jgi:cytochrome c551/c552
VIIAGTILIVVVALFFAEFIASSTAPAPEAEPVSETSYADRVAALLVDADPVNGEALSQQYGCHACHVLAGENVAPPFAGVATRAAERRPPMTAAAYLYESIVNPAVYVVEPYASSMAQDYAQRIPDGDMGDILAYLLTLHAE